MEVTVGVGFGGVSMDTFQFLQMWGEKIKSTFKGLESMPMFKGLVNKEELGRRVRIDQRSKREIWTVISRAMCRLHEEMVTVLSIAEGSG